MSPEDPAPLWSTEQLADYLGIGVQTVHALRRRGEAPPAYRVGKVLRFDPTEVAAWLLERREHADGEAGSALFEDEFRTDAITSEADHG